MKYTKHKWSHNSIGIYKEPQLNEYGRGVITPINKYTSQIKNQHITSTDNINVNNVNIARGSRHTPSPEQIPLFSAEMEAYQGDLSNFLEVVDVVPVM